MLADTHNQIDSVLHDVLFRKQIGSNVYSGIGYEERLVVVFVRQRKNMAAPPFGAQATIVLHCLAHQFVSMKTTLHQSFHFTASGHLHVLDGCRVAMGHVNQSVRRNVQLLFHRDRLYLRLRADQHGLDQPFAGSLNRGEDCPAAAWMNNCSRCPRLGPGALKKMSLDPAEIQRLRRRTSFSMNDELQELSGLATAMQPAMS